MKTAKSVLDSVLETVQGVFASKDETVERIRATRKGIDALRAAIAQLTDEKARVEKLLRPRLEVEADLRAWIQETGARAQSAMLQAVLSPSFRPRENRSQANNLRESLRLTAENGGPIPTLCALVPSQVFVYLTQGFDEAYAAGESISDADRAARLGHLDQQILELSLHEERVIRSLEASDIHIPRRPEADRRAVDAHWSEMPE